MRHVFLSFVAEDLRDVNLFRGQAKNENSELEFADFSVQTPYNSTNASYIRARISERIRAASVTVCLIGPDTARSDWVAWEVLRSQELGKRILGVRLRSAANDPVPSALISVGAQVYAWNISKIVQAIG